MKEFMIFFTLPSFSVVTYRLILLFERKCFDWIVYLFGFSLRGNFFYFFLNNYSFFFFFLFFFLSCWL